MNIASTIASEAWVRVTPGDPGTSRKYDLGLKRSRTTPTVTPNQAIYFEVTMDASGGAKSLALSFSTFQTGTIPAGVTVNGTPNASAAATDADGAAMNLGTVLGLRVVATRTSGSGTLTLERSGSGTEWTNSPVETATSADQASWVMQCENPSVGWGVSPGVNDEMTVSAGSGGVWTVKVMVIGRMVP